MDVFRVALALSVTVVLGLGGHMAASTPEAKAKQQATQQATEASKTFCAKHDAIKTALHYSVTKLDGRTATVAYPTWIGLSAENRELLLYALSCTVFGNALSGRDIKIVDLNGVVLR